MTMSYDSSIILTIQDIIKFVLALISGTLIALFSIHISIERREKKERMRAYGAMISEIEENIEWSEEVVRTLKEEKEKLSKQTILLGFHNEIWESFKSTGFLINLPIKIRTKMVHLYRDIRMTNQMIKDFFEGLRGEGPAGELRLEILEINKSIKKCLEDIKKDLEREIEQ